MSISSTPRRTTLLVLCALLLSACGGLGGEPRIVATVPPQTAAPQDVGHPVTPPDLALGAQLFAANCVECHGANGEANGELVQSGQVPQMPSFHDPAVRQKRPQEYFDIITNGNLETLMPPWKDALTEDERWAVAMYVYTLAYTPEQLAEGRELYAANCAECHGESGRGDGERAAELTRPVGDLTDLIELSALDDGAIYTVVTEGQGQMPDFAADLSEEQRWAVAAYTRTLSLANAETIQTPAATPEVEATLEPQVMLVVGRVANGTAGGSVPSELPLTLYAIETTDEGFQNESYPATTGNDGVFAFADVTVDPDKSYILSAVYRERIFTGDLVSGADLLANPELALTLYELTEDPTVITIVSMDTQVDAVGDGLQVLQEIIFRNASDRLYTNTLPVGENRFASVVVGLPPGAVGVGFPGDPQRYAYSEEQGVVVDTIPLPPGENHGIQLSYFIPYEDGAVIEQEVYYTLSGRVRLFLRPESVRASSQQLAPAEAQTIQNLVYQVYAGELSLQPGDVVRYELSGQAAATATDVSGSTSSDLPLILVVGLLVEVVIIGALFYIYARRRNRPQAQNKPAVINSLVRQIAELDNRRDAGKIDDAAYQTQRAQLKARLAELMEEQSD